MKAGIRYTTSLHIGRADLAQAVANTPVAADRTEWEAFSYPGMYTVEKARVYTPITDKQRINDLLREYSPITHVTADDPPMLIVHGDADELSPLMQASGMIDKLTAAGVKAKLVVAKGKGHAWKGMMQNEMKHIADWFDTHLAAEKQ